MLTEDKKAIKKNSKNKNKVRFCFDDEAKKVTTEINSIEDEVEIDADTQQKTNDQSPLNIESSVDQSTTDHILKVYLENQGVKSFKYDSNTCVRDVLICLKEKLFLNFIEYFGLVIRSNEKNCVSNFVLLEETRHLHNIREQFGHEEASFQCMLRFVFVPANFEALIQNDENAFNYLYEQSCNDVLNERFGNELKHEMILHLATLSILHNQIKIVGSDNEELYSTLNNPE